MSVTEIFSQEERQVLKKAATDDNRSVRNYIRTVILDALRHKGYLPLTFQEEPRRTPSVSPKEHT